ncbi:MAG: hypothetical protein JXR73_13455 [Candidatus Omnitrophica bacterium]|jgi:hypothetical protein|nr:hypothetical protein [Candidatus Omnitrophota bacterium]
MTSPIYFHPRIYELVMRVIYRGRYFERIRSVADLIPKGASVADVCAGDCSLYRYGLTNKGVEYRAYDLNPRFAAWAKKQGISMRRIDLRTEDVPPADFVVMLSALYQFIPDERIILEKLIRSVKRQVILTEPVHNISQSVNPLVRRFSQRLAGIDDNPCAQRFDEKTLRALLDDFHFQSIKPIAGGREILAIYTI